MVQTKTKRKQNKKNRKTKKRIYGGVVNLFNKSRFGFPKLFDNAINEGEKNDALKNIKRMTSVEDIDAALTELEKKDLSKERADIYHALDLRVSNLLENEIIRVLTPKMVKKLPFSNSKMKRMIEALETSRRNELEMVKLPPLQGARALTPSITEQVETPSQDPIPGDLSVAGLSGDGRQSEVQDDRGLLVDKTVELSDEVKREADYAVAKSNNTKSQIQQIIKQKETGYLFDDVNDSLVEIIGAAEEQVAASKAKSALDLFNVVTGRLQDITKAAEEEVERERIAAAETAEAELRRAAAEETERKRIEAEETERKRIEVEEADRKRAAAKLLSDAANKSLGDILGAVEEAERVAALVAAEKEEAERVAAEKAEAERIAAEKEEAERVAALVAADKAEAERVAALVAAEKEEAERVAALVAAEKEEAERVAALVAAEKEEAERVAAEEAERKRVAAAKLLSDTVNKSLVDVVDAAEVETKLNDNIGAANKARLANITKEERANAELLFNTVNQSLIAITNKAEVPNDGPSDDDDNESSSEDDSDSVSSNMSDYESNDDSGDENGDSSPPPGPNAEAEIQQLHDDTDMLITEFNEAIEQFDYTNVDCKHYYSLLYSLIKIHNQVKRNLKEIKKASFNVSEEYINQFNMISHIQTNIESIYSISPLYQKGQRMIASLEYYTRNKKEYLNGCQENNITDKERVANVAKHSENRIFAPALKGYINMWMEANGEPNINPIQLRFTNDRGENSVYSQMPPLEEINPSDTNINKLYVLRTVDQQSELITIDTHSIYTYERSILDDERTIAIIPDYMVNADGGEITAAELLELLQLYCDIYARYISVGDMNYVKEMEGKDDETFLKHFGDLLVADAELVQELQPYSQ